MFLHLDVHITFFCDGKHLIISITEQIGIDEGGSIFIYTDRVLFFVYSDPCIEFYYDLSCSLKGVFKNVCRIY